MNNLRHAGGTLLGFLPIALNFAKFFKSRKNARNKLYK